MPTCCCLTTPARRAPRSWRARSIIYASAAPIRGLLLPSSRSPAALRLRRDRSLPLGPARSSKNCRDGALAIFGFDGSATVAKAATAAHPNDFHAHLAIADTGRVTTFSGKRRASGPVRRRTAGAAPCHEFGRHRSTGGTAGLSREGHRPRQICRRDPPSGDALCAASPSSHARRDPGQLRQHPGTKPPRRPP